MPKYRKKPVVIEAWHFDGSFKSAGPIIALHPEGVPGPTYYPGRKTIDIQTLEGTMTAQAGDWIIKGVHGELYPCKPAIFAATYEPVEEPDAD